MTKWAAAVVCVLLGMAAPQAQQATAGGQSDSSQLGFYIGKWKEEGQSRSTPTGAFGRITGDETCAWFSGGPAVVCRETTQDSSGETDSIYILSFDAAKKVYSVYGTNNTGTIYAGTGTLDAGVWHWTAEIRPPGRPVMPVRYTFRGSGVGAFTMEIEASTGKGTWARIVGVTYKRAQ